VISTDALVMDVFWDHHADDDSIEGLDPDLQLVSGCEYILKCAPGSAADRNLCSANAWWVVTHEAVVVRKSPSLEGKPESLVHRGKFVYVVALESAWVQVDLRKKPPAKLAADKVAYLNRGPEFMWMMWDGKEKNLGMLLRPVAHLVALSKYRTAGSKLPRDAINWTVDEVNMFLGTGGFVKPGRQSAMLRDSRRLTRSVRGGVCGLEYRVDSTGKLGGIFAGSSVPSHTCVEVCPLLEVNTALHRQSPVLQRITVKLQGKRNRYAIVLGYGKLYSSSPCPNLNWSYHVDDQIVLWTREEVGLGTELTVDFSAPPQPLEEAHPMPTTWQPPPESTGKLTEAGYIIHGKSVIHGWGVFVTRDVQAGQLLECAPALIMDEAGADAMHNYRWGLKENDVGNFYIPLGYGCLYNHSETPIARGCLDVRRCVLEFYSTANILKGQEVFVSYGDKYFDEDFAGHRKSELMQIESINTNGDAEMYKMIELQRALIHCFSSDEYVSQMKLFNRARAAQSLGLKLPNQGRVKKHVNIVVDVQLPILERYGYTRNWEGALRMQEDVWKLTSKVEDDSEAVKNNILLNRLLNFQREPPAQLREFAELKLQFFGFQAWEAKEGVLTLRAPRRAPCSFLYFLLRERVFPDQSELKLVRRYEQQWVVLKEMEAIPWSSKIYIAGMETFMPKWRAQSNDDNTPESLIEHRLSEWEALSDWWPKLLPSPLKSLELMLSFWNYHEFDFEMSSFKIHGTWDDFKGNDMSWTGTSYIYIATLGKQGWESFQIVMDDDWQKALYPNVKDANPLMKHTLIGPDGKGHGFNWTLGGHRDASSKCGHNYKIELRLNEYGGLLDVTWSNLGFDVRAEAQRLATSSNIATQERERKRVAEERQRERDSERLDQEFAKRRDSRKAEQRIGNSVTKKEAAVQEKNEQKCTEEQKKSEQEEKEKKDKEEKEDKEEESAAGSANGGVVDHSGDTTLGITATGSQEGGAAGTAAAGVADAGLKEEKAAADGDSVDSEEFELMEALGIRHAR